MVYKKPAPKVLSHFFPLLFLITLFGALLRFFFLDRIPNAIGGDELNYIIAAKSIFLYGTDITHSWNPLSILWFQYPPGTTQAELPYLFQSLIVGPFPFSLFNARVLPALLSTLSIPLLFFITRKLFNNQTALISAFLFSINPWTIYVGRTAYENAFAVFFFLCAWCVLFYFKSWRLLFSVPLFFAAFYSYIGTKLIFIPFIAVLVWYSYKFIHHGAFKKIYVSIFASCVLLVLFFVYSLFSGPGSNRTGEILLPTSQDLSTQVDALRRASITNPITPLFENKPVLFMRILAEKLYKTFSFDYLFFQGDLFFTVGRHGLFYAIDLLFLLTGIWFLIKKHKRELLFLTALIFISTIPQLFHTAKIDNFSFHLILMYPLLLIIISYGVYQILSRSKVPFTYVIFTALYLLFLLNFLQIYFFQMPLQGHFDFKLRTLSRYMMLSSSQNPTILYTPNGANIQQKHMFYSNNLKLSENITIQNCPDENLVFPENQTIIIDSFCDFVPDASYIALAQLKDGGETYKIYNDSVCKDVNLKSYPSNITLSAFLIEDLSAGNFCQTYMVKQ